MDEGGREFLKTLLGLAWADGEFSMDEMDVLAGILTRLGYSPEVILTEPDPSDGVPAQPTTHLAQFIPDPASRLQALRDLVSVAFADRDLSLEEFSYLEKLASQLGASRDYLMQLVRGSIHLSEILSRDPEG